MTPAPVPSEPSAVSSSGVVSNSNLGNVSSINPTLNNSTLNSLNININAGGGAAGGANTSNLNLNSSASSASSAKDSDGVLDLNESLLPAGHVSSMSILGGDALSAKSD